MIGFHELFVVLRPIGLLGLLVGVEMIEVAKELIETVVGRQILVEVAEMVLAKLSCCIAQRLERLGNGDIPLSPPRAVISTHRPEALICAFT
jgi:hypothetical protein